MSSKAHHHSVDPMDPHGFQEGHHGHTVVDWRIIIGVLAILLFFTFLTVSAANFEKWIASEFNVTIPTWINVAIVLGIATIKGSLVCLYFMQLRYDKPLNAIIFLFCIFGVGLFLGFSALDLGARGRVYDYKSSVIKPGFDGGSMGMSGTDDNFHISFGPRYSTSQMSVVDFARQKYIDKYGLEVWEKKMAEKHHAHGHGHDEPNISTAQRSVPRHGLTPDLYSERDDGHRDGH